MKLSWLDNDLFERGSWFNFLPHLCGGCDAADPAAMKDVAVLLAIVERDDPAAFDTGKDTMQIDDILGGPAIIGAYLAALGIRRIAEEKSVRTVTRSILFENSISLRSRKLLVEKPIRLTPKVLLSAPKQ